MPKYTPASEIVGMLSYMGYELVCEYPLPGASTWSVVILRTPGYWPGTPHHCYAYFLNIGATIDYLAQHEGHVALRQEEMAADFHDPIHRFPNPLNLYEHLRFLGFLPENQDAMEKAKPLSEAVQNYLQSLSPTTKQKEN